MQVESDQNDFWKLLLLCVLKTQIERLLILKLYYHNVRNLIVSSI